MNAIAARIASVARTASAAKNAIAVIIATVATTANAPTTASVVRSAPAVDLIEDFDRMSPDAGFCQRPVSGEITYESMRRFSVEKLMPIIKTFRGSER